MIIRQDNHNSEVNRQRVEFENRIESQWQYWREVTRDQIQQKWDHVANRGSAALTRLENRIQSNFNIQLQDTKRQIKAMRKKVARKKKKSTKPAMYNQIHGLSAQMTRMTQMAEEVATTMDGLGAQMTEERGRLGMTLERVATLEHSVATIRTTTANLDERMGVLFGEIRTTTATRAEFEQVKAHVGDTRHRHLVLERFIGHTFGDIFTTLNFLIEVQSFRARAQQAETEI